MARRWLSALASPARIAFWAALVFAVFMALDPRPPAIGVEAFGDKAQHMLAFLVLTALAQAGFDRTPRWRIAERLSFTGAMIEVMQALPILHRDCDIRDWIADTVMVVLVTVAFVAIDPGLAEERR